MSRPRIRFLIYTALALIVSTIPVVHYPFGWFETFFHELSHGIAALVSGGSIDSIELNLDGSGVCTTLGGSNFLILFSGYAGSGLWGSLIYFLSSIGEEKRSKAIAFTMSALVIITGLLWARDAVTFVILGVIASIFILSSVYFSNKLTHSVTSFIALYVALNAFRSPLDLLDGRDIGDGSALADLTMLPEVVWILSWCGISFFFLYLLFRKQA
ncbi:MAG: M50 family metallopeptidase [Candidatus Thiodiazotropha sp. DIVDIV]